MEMTLAHWLYLLVTVVVIATMLFRRGVVLPIIIGTFLVAAVYKGNIVSGFQAVFNANLVAAKELFSIFLIISLMIALLNALKGLGADQKLIMPLQKVMVNGHVSFLILFATTYVISLFFWPTPAVPLICALLVPAAVRAGVPVMVAAMVVVISGQGMALSSDYIIQVAPVISASAAGIDKALITDKLMVLSLITGFSALSIVYFSARKAMSKKTATSEEGMKMQESFFEEVGELAATVEEDAEIVQRKERWGKAFAFIVPLSMLAVMIYMFQFKISGGSGFEGTDGAAFVGGVATILLVLATIALNRIQALDQISEHLTDGFVFAFKAMAPVIPIAGFFFMGSSDFTPAILSLGEDAATPAFLFDAIQAGQVYIPQNPVFAGYGILLIGIITGLDGSGFSGLPLTGALSGALASGANIDASTMAAIGQMGAIWTGGGTIIAWSSLVAVAGFLKISPIELARRNFIPVMVSLLAATTVAIIIW
ncbi:putative transport protein [Bacillus freudenreichii]|nr:putative transport protein [Bacillus freudenreichii]